MKNTMVHKDFEKNFLKNISSIIQEDLTTGDTTKNYEKLISKLST